jgi:alkylation response protein AidB-like acyl-CoA dehydrogenase
MAFAHAEADSRHTLSHVATRAAPSDAGWVLTGIKRNVANGGRADTLVVSARIAGGDADRDGIGLFVVERGVPGLSTRPLRMLDSTRAADVVLDAVPVSRKAAVGAPGNALPLIEDVVVSRPR